MNKRSKNYNKSLIESLKDQKEAIAYLNTAFEEIKDGKPESHQLFNDNFKKCGPISGRFYYFISKNKIEMRKFIQKWKSKTYNFKNHNKCFRF